jgi:phenylacetate-CoA ligase
MSRLYNVLCRHAILPLGDRLSGQRVLPWLRHYAGSQYWPQERLAAEQDRLVREVVRTAWTEVPFYRQLYDLHGVDVAAVRGVADLPRLPVVTKRMLREAAPGDVTRRTPWRAHRYSTSGSTGHPFSLMVDADTMSRARALMLLRTMYAGYEPGDPVLQTGTAPDRGLVKGLKDRLLRVAYVASFDLSESVIDRCLEVMDRRRVRFLTGYAQTLHLFAQRARAVGFNRRLQAAVSWGALLLPHYRDQVRAAFGCRVYDSYGVGEGMQIAAQCEASEETFHQFSLHVACEVCADGQPLPPGEHGELVLTRLDAGATPLIRYAIGDMGAWTNGEPCTCGRSLPLMRSIDGRSSDIIRTPSGRILILHFFSRIFSSAPTIRQFQIVQTRPEAIRVRLVTEPGFTSDHWERVRSEIASAGDPALQVEMELVDDIPVGANAKRRYIVSEIG